MGSERGELLCAGLVQPHRPKHRRHSHRREKCRGAENIKRQDTRQGDRKILSLRRAWKTQAAARQTGELSVQGRSKKSGLCEKPPRAGSQDRRYGIQAHQNLGCALTHGVPACDRAHAPDTRADGHAGMPLLGDGKYGSERFNKNFGEKGQALYSYKLEFAFPTDAGILEYLRGKCFTVQGVEFAEKYFGIASLDGI